MGDNIRTIKITKEMPLSLSEVPEDMPVPAMATVSRKGRKTRKQLGGEQPAPVGSIGVPLINITKIPDTPDAKAIMQQASEQKGGSAPVAAVTGAAAPSNIPPGPQIHVGGTQVVLKRKNRTSKVLLKKRTMGGVQQEINPTKTLTNSGPVVIGGAKKVRKVTIRHVRNKMKRSHKAVKHAKQIPIDKLKKILIEKKLIKASSKAPESILRQIYADSIIVGKKTL
jgi:hypothetical protein